MSATYNERALLINMKGERTAIDKLERKTFTERRDHLRNIGTDFIQMWEHDKLTDDKATVRGAYAKRDKALKPIVSLTTMVNECVPFAQTNERTLTTITNAYLKVGAGERSKDSKGVVREVTQHLGAAVKGKAEGRWNQKTGKLTSGSNRGSSNAKKAEKAEKDVIEEVMAVWGVSALEDSNFDFRYFTNEELTHVQAGLTAELKRRKAKGKQLA